MGPASVEPSAGSVLPLLWKIVTGVKNSSYFSGGFYPALLSICRMDVGDDGHYKQPQSAFVVGAYTRAEALCSSEKSILFTGLVGLDDEESGDPGNGDSAERSGSENLASSLVLRTPADAETDLNKPLTSGDVASFWNRDYLKMGKSADLWEVAGRSRNGNVNRRCQAKRFSLRLGRRFASLEPLRVRSARP